MNQNYTLQTNPASQRLHYTENIIPLAGGFNSGITDLILLSGGINSLALGTIAFRGPFYDRGVVYRCTSHVQLRSGDSCALKDSAKAHPGVYRQGGRHSR